MAGTGNEAIAADREGWSLDELLKDELSRGDAALGRTETKTSILLAVFSPIVTAGLAVLPRASVPAAARLTFWAALVLLVLALLLLLWNVRPRLRGSGFTTYVSMTGTELTRHFAAIADDPRQWHCERLLVVARLGAKKFKLLRLATTLIIAALLLAVAAAIVAAI
ncbi:Pycsar system effector family protein [Amycolatopsis nigrescens]|uniref:Pycsar system effector family protein n=1 Tax=Amycolatopsis nigrescens TaxID=381445 RepID=UPI00036CFCF2|nr:Pycsar system effector family protein [Amycolatopsis nigrescens]